MAESLPTGRSFGRVSATDADELGYISYSLAAASDLFQIDNTTGALSLVQTLDFEAK